ncbi:MAG: hypothetical protein LQ338_003913 [Usnochroma carphineum]|nr:MAG: hypothetical protein LQ338_003913 [Usnochroma carphineum]
MDKISLRGFLDLPTELLIQISSHLSKVEVKALRLTCSGFKEFANPLIYTTAHVAARRRVFDAFKGLSSQPDLSQHVIEIIYDSSWFDPETAEEYRQSPEATSKSDKPSTTGQSRAKYIEAFDEQEKILEHELAPAVRHAMKNFLHVRRLIYADFARSPGFHLDRYDDLGGAFRLGDTQWPVDKAENPPDRASDPALALTSDREHMTDFLSRNAYLRRRYFGLALLLEPLSQPDSKTQIADLRIGDSTYSRGAGGIPDTLFLAFSNNKYGLSCPFNHVRELDLTFNGCASRRPPDQMFPYFPHLELLRLVGPVCSPREMRFSPRFRKPVIQLHEFCEGTFWPKLRALELKWISIRTQDLLNLFDLHMETLRYVVLHEVYMHEEPAWVEIEPSLCSMYPSLIVEHTHHYLPSIPYKTQIINFSLHHGVATLSNTGVPREADHLVDDAYDEDQISNYSAIEGFEDDERYSSEELDFSGGSDSGDSLEIDELAAFTEPH